MSLTLPGILVDVTWLRANLEQPELLILDATVELPAPRFDGDYRSASGYPGWLDNHIPGSLHADLLNDLADSEASFSFALPPTAALTNALAALGVSEQRRVVIYDRADGFWAARLWWMLRGIGIQAAVLDGGLKAWESNTVADQPLDSRLRGGPPMRNDGVIPAATVVPAQAGIQWSGNPGRADANPSWVNRAQVEAIVAGQAEGILICALGSALFDGTAPTRYARRGHIPGSLNLPARTLFDAQGRYLPKDALAAVFEGAFGPELLNSDTPLILYCGGGISAAANALALTLLGRQHVAIYDGSLQEWAADPALPMTTGAPPA